MLCAQSSWGTETSPNISTVLAAAGLSLILGVTAPYPTMEPPHLLLLNTAPVTAGTTTLQTRVRPDRQLAATRPPDVRRSCISVPWSKRRRSDIGSYVGPMFQTVAGDLPHLVQRTGRSLDYCALSPSAFCKVTIQRRMDSSLFRLNFFIEAARFASIPARTDKFLQNFAGLEEAWSGH